MSEQELDDIIDQKDFKPIPVEKLNHLARQTQLLKLKKRYVGNKKKIQKLILEEAKQGGNSLVLDKELFNRKIKSVFRKEGYSIEKYIRTIDLPKVGCWCKKGKTQDIVKFIIKWDNKKVI